MRQDKNHRLFPIVLSIVALALCGIQVVPSDVHAARAQRVPHSRQAKLISQDSVTFDMAVSGGAAGCLPYASGTVTITPIGPVEIMDVNVGGLVPNTEFDLFVLQLPTAPFGVAWYQGDIETDDNGQGSGEFVGRFSIETFAVAQGSGAAPVVHDQPPFPDANINPPFEPIHMFHLGLWFGSPDDAAGAGCPAAVTRFNGTHTAGIQALNTANFPDDQGPLLQVQ